MATYEVTATDRRRVPPSYARDRRHLGYDDAERTRPFAHYLRSEVRPIQDHVREALLAGAAPAEFGYGVDEAARRLSAPGYDEFETGWARSETGLTVACLTDMPGVTAQMWDWWFGWHLTDTARYKLWHPHAHQYAAVGEDRSHDRTLTDRQRYRSNVSYVDEYIGKTLSRFAIRFVGPSVLGIEEATDTTHVCARVGPSDVPVAVGWLVHQVRPTDGGCEMRSRFFLGNATVLDLPPTSVTNPTVGAVITSRVGRVALKPVIAAAVRRATGDRLGRDLLHHCASEMNHLAGFLPDLYAEFRTTP